MIPLSASRITPGSNPRLDVDLWVRRGCALVVAGVAAYVSYQHQREFALHSGADVTSAALWPLSVDGLLTLASTALLKSQRQAGGTSRSRWAIWLAFLLGIAVSLAANIATAPALAWQPVLVAGWPPVSLLLAVELLAHRPQRRERLADSETAETTLDAQHTGTETEARIGLSRRTGGREPTAEQVMWVHYQRERFRGRTPTGAELDRVAGTNNYGRAVVKRWRQAGRLSSSGAVPALQPECAE